jgi:2-polyprenyl-6-methoxyphenol hydroxylase-like FAD-dependent oxidoreductase
MDVAIFGAGIAGLMTAITLQAQGYRCRIYERSRPDQQAGMGFILMPEGIDCLQGFGVDLSGATGGVPLHRYCHRNAAGEILSEQVMPAGARSIRRRDLMTALANALPDALALTFGSELDRLAFDDAGQVVCARLSSGERVEADLYVAADGLRSSARQALFPDWPTTQAQVIEVVGLARCDQARRWVQRNFNKFHAEAGRIAIGLLPVDADHVIWYLQFDSQRFASPQQSPEARRAFVEKLVGDWADPIPQLLAASDFSRVHVWRPINTDLIPRFHQGNLVLVGDAAHPLLPFTSQGVSSAIADAVALADAMSAEDDLADALAAYSIERRQQCAPYVAKGRELTENFLAPQAAGAALLPIAL